MKVREPVERPLDIVGLELLLSASQAFVVGVLMYLAVGIWPDRGVGVASAAVILALLALAVGGGWLFWLLGGHGWPMAAANVPAAMFLGFALILGLAGDGLIRLDPLPLVLALAGSIYGIVGGVFLDSPRRWRWDQRQKLRPGTEVPRVSPATRSLAARVPRSLSRPPRTTSTGADLTASSVAGLGEEDDDSGSVGTPYVRMATAIEEPDAEPDSSAAPPAAELEEVDEALAPETGESLAASPQTPGSEPQAVAPAQARPEPAPRPAAASEPEGASGTIELPTSVEPKAQRSPWAWAAPPEWTRDEDDDASGSSGGR
jgi:hypothetical protein